MTKYKYIRTEFHALFETFQEAVKFNQDPAFRSENQHQNTVDAVIAKAPGLEYLVAFGLYHDPADTEEVTGMVRDLIHAYGGKLDGDPEPDPAEEPAAATEQHSVKDAAPWQS